MKNSNIVNAILASGFLAATLIFTGCDGKKENKEAESNHMEADSVGRHGSDSTQVAYACPMHPEVTGKDGDKCSKCGMKLEAVKEAEHQH